MLIPIIVSVTVLVIVIAGVVFAYLRYYARRAERFAYGSRADYMRAVPQTDEEKREAVDQTFLGLVICVLGVLFPPLLLAGVLPLYVGGRKTVCVLMALGYVDDSNASGA